MMTFTEALKDTVISRFNLEITNIRQMYTTVVLAMYADGQRTLFPVKGKKGAGIDSFQTAVASGAYTHVALLNVTNVMAVWHARSGGADEDELRSPAGGGAVETLDSEYDAWSDLVNQGFTAEETIIALRRQNAMLFDRVDDLKSRLAVADREVAFLRHRPSTERILALGLKYGGGK